MQSNHVRQTAAVGAEVRHDLHRPAGASDRHQRPATYLGSGNVLLDKLFGPAGIEDRPGGLDMNAEAEKKGAELRSGGEAVYVIPGGGSNTVGALGYVSCAQELMQQADEMGLRIDRIVNRDRQRRNACRPGGRARGDKRRGSGARHRRAAAA